MAKTTYTNRSGQAVQGHDPVAYFTVGTPTKGDPSISYEWNEATWLFVNQENRDAFVAEPERYAPAFGGHCSLASSMGIRVKASPKRWRIEDDQLYLDKNLLAASMHNLFSSRIRRLAREA